MRKLLFVTCFVLLVFSAASAAAAEHFELLSGTDYATGVWVLQGESSQPAALILGGVHGDEPAGAFAARELCTWAVKRGTAVIIPEVNKLALTRQVRTLPGIGDVNRAYPGDLGGTPAERLAAEIVKLMERYHVSLFLDLHEGRTFHRLDKTSVGQMILFTPNDKSMDMGLEAIRLVNEGISEPYKKYAFGAHPIPGSGAWYATKQYGIAAFTVETSGEQSMEDRIQQHLVIVRYLLTAGGIELK